MSQLDSEPLVPEVERLLADERRFPPQTAEVRARVTARARASRGAASLRSPRSVAGGRAWLLVAAVLVTAVTAAAVVRWGTPPPASDVHSNAVRSQQREALGTPVASQAPRELAHDGHSPTPSAGSESDSAEPAKAASSARPSPPGDSYALELAVLKRARAAVTSGKFSVALETVAEHQRRFPQGKLREEREALRVKALAGLGKHDEARSAAERFREHFPNSVLAPRLEATARPGR